jgi:hypothetical protein
MCFNIDWCSSTYGDNVNSNILFPILAFAGYSIFTTMLGQVTAFASSVIAVACYSTTVAVIAWVYALASDQASALKEMSIGQISLLFGIGALLFVADYSYAMMFKLGLPPAIIFGVIACIAVGAMAFFSLFTWTAPSLQQGFGVVVCTIGAFIIYTAK